MCIDPMRVVIIKLEISQGKKEKLIGGVYCKKSLCNFVCRNFSSSNVQEKYFDIVLPYHFISSFLFLLPFTLLKGVLFFQRKRLPDPMLKIPRESANIECCLPNLILKF